VKRKNKIITALSSILLAVAVFFFLKSRGLSRDSGPVHAYDPQANESSSAKVTDASEGIIHGNAPKEAMTSYQSDEKNIRCQGLRDIYRNSREVKANNIHSTRFYNLHKKIEGTTYRLRFFYKDGAEAEVLTYLLYKEDNNGDEHIVESKSYKKGPMYQEIENAQGETTYTEEGLTIGRANELFLHYINNRLEMLQGNLAEGTDPEKNFIDCKF
jgi:hypothetical protein